MKQLDARVADPIDHQRRLLISDLSIVLVAVIWGSTYVVMQVVGHSLPVMAFLALRFLCSLPVIAVMGWRSLRTLTAHEVRSGAVFGTLLFGVLACETAGVRFTSAANAGFLITVSVVLIPLFEWVLFRRRYHALVYVATLCGLAGCGLLSLAHGFRPQLGDLIILAAALIRGFQITLFGRGSTRGAPQSLVNITFVEFVMVSLLAGLSSAAFETGVPGRIAGLGGSTWLLIVYLGVLGTSFAFFAQLRSARIGGSARVGIILSTEPVFAAVFAVLLAGESLGPVQIAGGLLIVGAAFVGRLMTGREAKPARRAEVSGSTRPGG
ncbi:DMT family transporter [Amycolatopsis sp. NEAU-NG30]|uniref:DMT family transporter n=1 Tax=Amycolatopsis melonis TaxID=3156488 RepID=A0ABV0LIV8_9PSEU